jgi:hypothetical protein
MANHLLPVVKLFFACEEATFDHDAAAYRLVAPLHALVMPPGVTEKFECEGFDCYAQLSDAMGTFRFSVQVLPGDLDVVIYQSPSIQLTFTPRSRIGAFDVVFRLRRVRFRQPDFYRVRLMCNHTPLPNGLIWLRVLGGSWQCYPPILQTRLPTAGREERLLACANPCHPSLSNQQ